MRAYTYAYVFDALVGVKYCRQRVGVVTELFVTASEILAQHIDEREDGGLSLISGSERVESSTGSQNVRNAMRKRN